MSLVALATEQPDQDTTNFDALPGISAVAMTDDALAAVEGQSALVGDPEGPAHYVITPSGRFNGRLDEYGPGDHNNFGLVGAATGKYGAQGPNFVLTPSGQLAGSGVKP